MANGTIKNTDWKLLWINASPNSVFASQTISLNLSGYSRIKIDFNINSNASSTESVYQSSEFGMNFPRTLICGFWTGKYYQRPTKSQDGITITGIIFNDATVNNSYGTNGTTANDYMIPIRIYAK